MDPHVILERALALNATAAHLTLKLPLRLVPDPVPRQHLIVVEGLVADVALVGLREVDECPVPEHLLPAGEHEVAVCALYIHRLLLVKGVIVVFEAGLGVELLPAFITLDLLGHWQTVRFALVPRLVPEI